MKVYISKATGETSEATKQAAKEPPSPSKEAFANYFSDFKSMKAMNRIYRSKG